MSSASRFMTMRARIERPGSTRDAHGGRAINGQQIVSEDAPCFIYTGTRRTLDAQNKQAQLESVRGLFRKDAEIKRGDWVVSVTDRNGTAVIDSRLEVLAVSKKSAGPGVSHLEVELRRVS